MTILITSASSSKQFLMLKFKTTNYTRIKKESFESELKKKKTKKNQNTFAVHGVM